MLLFWTETAPAELVAYFPALFWLQMTVVIGGVIWCVAMMSTLLVGGWYASTHPTTGTDRVILQVARVLRFLTFGLTEYPPPHLNRGCEDEWSTVW